MNTSEPSSKSTSLHDLGIEGEIVVANFSVSDIEYLQASNDVDFTNYVKKKLCYSLVEHLLKESKHVLFTKHQHRNEGITTFIARMTVVPKDTTQKLVKEVKQF